MFDHPEQSQAEKASFETQREHHPEQSQAEKTIYEERDVNGNQQEQILHLQNLVEKYEMQLTESEASNNKKISDLQASHDSMRSLLLRFLPNEEQNAVEYASIVKDDQLAENSGVSSVVHNSNVSNYPGGNIAIQDEIPSHNINEDTFSFLMLVNYRSGEMTKGPMLLGWFVCLFQITAYILILLNSYDPNSDNNVFGFPPNVPINVRTAELVAIVVTCVLADDIRISLSHIFHGYFGCRFQRVDGSTVSFGNWLLSIISRGFQGGFYVFLTFILIMKSDDVVELLLNFSAMQFISELDDMAFHLAAKGYLGKGNQKMAREVEETTYQIIPKETHKLYRCKRNVNHSGMLGLFVFMFIFSPLLISWSKITIDQVRGIYSCKKVLVQFGDDVRHDISALSGSYHIVNEGSTTTYAFQVPESIGTAHLRFCSRSAFWGLTYSPNDFDVCENWVVRSEDSAGVSKFDVLTAMSLTWFARNDQDKGIIMDNFRMVCFDCNAENFCEPHGSCDKETDACVCNDGWYGARCDFHEPCLTIEIGDPDSHFVGFREWASTYTRLESSNGNTFLDMNGHPVYYGQSTAAEFDLMIYSGRRWILTSTVILDDLEGEVAKEDLVIYLEERFHAFWSNPKWSFISDPTDMDTATESATPVGLNWFKGEISALQSLELSLVCIVCDSVTNQCLYDGVCQSDNRCDCSNNGASGALCQAPPASNGFCDPVFNTPEFNFDGGDCCHATCVSDDFTCGWDKNNILYKHYCNCIDPVYDCPDGSGSTCWVQNSERIPGKTNFAESGKSLALSADARVLAIGEPGGDMVRVYGNDGSRWVQRGEPIRGQLGSRLGDSVAISGDGSILVVGSPEFVSPGVDTSKIEILKGLVSVYEFSGNNWQKLDQLGVNLQDFDSRLRDGRLGTSLGMSEDGRIIVFSVEGTRRTKGAVFGFERNETTGFYFQSQPMQLDDRPLYDALYILFGQTVSVTTSGNMIAFDATEESTDTNVHVATYEPKVGSFALRDFSTPGCCPLLSGNGRVLVVTLQKDPAQYQVFAWEFIEGIGGNWTEQGDPLDGTPLAISSDGLTLAILISDSIIQTLFWEGELWTSQGNVASEFDASVILSRSLRGDDRVMVVGLPSDNTMGFLGGQTFTYQLISSDDDVNRCENRNSIIHLEIITDTKPNETMWEIRDAFTKELFLAGGPYDEDDQVAASTTATIQMPSGTSCAEFTIYDLGGDGICCGHGLGSYSLAFGGVIEKIGANFKWSEQHTIGNCQKTCPEGESLVSIELTTDRFPFETSWSLTQNNGSTILLRGGPYADSEATFYEERCMPSDECADFTILDDFGDGICCVGGFGSYVVTYGGDVVKRGAKFGTLESIQVGNCSSAAAGILSSEEHSLFIDLSAESSETDWFLFEIESRNMISGNSSRHLDLDGQECYLFEVFETKTDGISARRGYSLALDGKEVISSSNSVSGNFHVLGECLDDMFYYDIRKGNSIICSDDSLNSCKAPASCTPYIEPIGDNVLGIDLVDGEWITNGAYSLRFENDCRVACFGTCNTATPISFGCRNDESILRFQIKTNSSINWIVKNNEGEVIQRDDQNVDVAIIISERVCVPSNACAVFEIRIGLLPNGDYGDCDYDLYLDGKYMVSGDSKDGFAFEYVCPGDAPVISGSSLLIDEATTSIETMSLLPSNDFCDNAKPLSLGVSVTHSTTHATVDYVPRCGDTTGSVSRGVWYSVNGNGNELLASLCGSDYDTQISIFSGPCNSLVCVDGNDDYCGIQSGARWNSTLGTDYLILVYGYGVDNGTYTLSVIEATSVNDNCIDAVFLNIGDTIVGYTDIAEVDDVPSCEVDVVGSPGVWYAVVGTGRKISVSTCELIGFDTIINVFTGSCDKLVCMSGNDDACGYQSRVSWNSVQGVTYFIYLTGYGSGPVALNVEETLINDLCSNAISLQLDAQVSSSTALAAAAGNWQGSPSYSCGYPHVYNIRGPGVWFVVTGTGNYMEANTCKTPELDTVLSVHSGDCNALECVAYNDDYCNWQSVAPWQSIENVNYYILVESISSFFFGNFTLEVYELV